MNTYKITDPKPSFRYGQAVDVDMSTLGSDGLRIGKVVGKGSEHVIDMWLIEFATSFGPTYPYNVLSVPHTSILMPQ